MTLVDDSIIHSIYSCATGDLPWDAAVRPIMDLIDARCAGVVRHSIAPTRAEVLARIDVDPQTERAYVNEYVHKNPVMNCLSAMPLGYVTYGSGAVDLDLKEIGALAALAGVEIAGQGQGRLVFSVEDDIPLLSANIDLSKLSGTGFSVSDARLNATVDDYLAAPKVSGTAKVDTVDAGGTAIRDVGVDVALDDGWTTFTGDATADGSPVRLSGRLQQADGATQIELDTARVTYRNLPVTLSEPATVTVRDGAAQIGNLVLSPGGGSVSVSGRAGGEALDLAIRLNGVPLTAIDAVAPGTGLRGSVSGTVSVEGKPSAPVARYDLTADSVSINSLVPIDAPSLSVTAKGAYRGDAVDFNATAAGGGLQLNADGKVGLTGAKADLKTQFTVRRAETRRQCNRRIGGCLGDH